MSSYSGKRTDWSSHYIGKQSEWAPCTANSPSFQLPYIRVSRRIMGDPNLVLSLDDVDVHVQKFMRAGYSEHRIFVHCGV